MPSTSKSLQAILGAPGINGKRVTVLSKDGIIDFMRSIICSKQETKEAFYVLDLGAVTTLMDRWTRALPTVQPYYAVKCNPNLSFLGAMAALGSNFDCASQAEIESILSLGVSPDRIIFANPCKAESHIKYAASVGVNLTTFDSMDEIEKMQKWHPKCDLIIRIKAPDDSGARFPLGSKFGALPEEVETLLRAAQTAQLTVVGISFHIGSASTDSRAYQQAIAAAKTAFEMATKLGMPQMSVLNIGGGFMANSQFDETATVVKAAIQSCFGNYSGLRVIAEPGRFFAESIFTLATSIIGKRIRNEVREYWISDGIYGSLNCIILDNAIVLKCMPLALMSNLENPTCKGSKTYNSTVFGPTCDALDTVLRGYQLPKLQVNDWLVFSNMGAYTTATGTNFNGFNTSAIPTYLAYLNPKF